MCCIAARPEYRARAIGKSAAVGRREGSTAPEAYGKNAENKGSPRPRFPCRGELTAGPPVRNRAHRSRHGKSRIPGVWGRLSRVGFISQRADAWTRGGWSARLPRAAALLVLRGVCAAAAGVPPCRAAVSPFTAGVTGCPALPADVRCGGDGHHRAKPANVGTRRLPSGRRRARRIRAACAQPPKASRKIRSVFGCRVRVAVLLFVSGSVIGEPTTAVAELPMAPLLFNANVPLTV